MMYRSAPKLLALAAGALLSGCVSLPRDAGFGELQRNIEEQTRQTVVWNRGPIEPPSDERVRELLVDPLNADRAVQVALANNRDIQATLEELGIARAEYLDAFLPRNPVLDVNRRFPGQALEVGLTQALVDLLQFRSRRALSQAELRLAQMRITAAVLNFAAEVRAGFYELQAAQQVLARQRVILEAQEAWALLAKRQHEAGNISDLDLEIEQSLYEQVKLESARAEVEALAAREQLTADLGLLSDRTPWTVPAEFAPMPDSEIPREEIETIAVARRFDIAVARQEVDAARRARPIAGIAFLDELAAGISYEREPEGESTRGPAAAIPIPIWNRGAAARARAFGILRAAQQRLAATEVTARSEARVARERLLEARARAEYVRDVILPRRRRILYLMQLEYNAMIRGVFQLIQARQSLTNAEMQLIEAQRDYWIARTELETALTGVAGFSARPERPRPPRRLSITPAPQQVSKENE